MMVKDTLPPQVQENVALAPYTTFRIGGPARYFLEARSTQEIVEGVRAALESGTPFFVLTGGSNVLVSSRGFDGLVLLVRTARCEIEGRRAVAEAGVPLSVLVEETIKLGLAGLEWAGGLPGSVGGAVRGNAGAFGGEMKDVVEEVECLDKEGSVRRIAKPACEFGYRTSVFKEQGWIVLSAVLQLAKGDGGELVREAEEHILYRQERHPLEFPNAGSVFKNCALDMVPESVRKMFAEKIKQDPFPILPAAVLIAAAGLQGKRIGGAEVSAKHTNYIVNTENATSDDVLKLMERVQDTVKEKFDVALEPEVQVVG